MGVPAGQLKAVANCAEFWRGCSLGRAPPNVGPAAAVGAAKLGPSGSIDAANEMEYKCFRVI